MKYLSYDPEGYGVDEHETLGHALEVAEGSLSHYRDAAGTDGWSDAAERVCVAVVVHRAAVTGLVTRQEAALDEEGFDENGHCWDPEWDCIYDMQLREVPTPPRDALREVLIGHGFRIKDGNADLEEYVYAAVEAAIALDRRAR